MALQYVSDIALPRDPIENLHATTKQYVDAGLSSKAAATHTHTTSQIVGLGTAATCNTGIASGNIPILDTSGKLNISVIPATAITDTFVVATEAAMLALTCQKGDVAVRTDLKKSFILRVEPASALANWQELLSPTDAVASVNGKNGTVILVASDVGAIAATEKASANGVATLDASSKIPIAQLPTQSTLGNSTTTVPTSAAVFAHSNVPSAHSSTSTPTPNRIAMFDTSSRLKSAEPSATNDVATKNYVDTKLGAATYRGTFSGNGSMTSFPITHGLNNSEVVVDVFKMVDDKPIKTYMQWEATSANQITLFFAVAPANAENYVVKVRI
ncbi:MAG: hypothetical protein LBT05_10100 [Planctomycetaceae bacterium]|nr:hypothetical protein [Planctomycetaceae bacterium]